MVFVADSDQISALVGLANYDRPGIESVVTPMGAGCHQICIDAYREAELEEPGGGQRQKQSIYLASSHETFVVAFF